MKKLLWCNKEEHEMKQKVCRCQVFKFSTPLYSSFLELKLSPMLFPVLSLLSFTIPHKYFYLLNPVLFPLFLPMGVCGEHSLSAIHPLFCLHPLQQSNNFATTRRNLPSQTDA